MSDPNRPLVTRRAPRSLSLGDVPDDPIPALINKSGDLGDCSMCGGAVRESGWDLHRYWHHTVEGFGFPEGYKRNADGRYTSVPPGGPDPTRDANA